jgi:hypothetical protein
MAFGMFGSAAPNVSRRSRPVAPMLSSDEQEMARRQGISPEEFLADKAQWSGPPVGPHTTAHAGSQGAGGMFGRAAPALPQPQAMTPQPAQAPAAMPPMGLFGSSAPKPKRSTGMWSEIQTNPLTFLLGGTAGLDRSKEEEQRQKFTSTLDSLNLDPETRARAEMDREGFFRALNEASASRAKPITDTFYDQEAGQWVKKPQGLMSVADNTDIYDPDQGKSVYTNAPAPKPPEPYTLGTDQVRLGPDNKVIARGPPGRSGAPETPNGFRYVNGELEFIRGGPADPDYIDAASDARARGIPEFSQTEQRQYKNTNTELNKFEAMLNDYFRVLEENGGGQTVEGFWNQQQIANIKAAQKLLTLGLKQAYQGGALDKGLIEITDKIISNPVGWESFNKGGAKEFKKSAEPIFNNIAYARAQIPEQFRVPGAPAEGEARDTPAPQAPSSSAQRIPSGAIQKLRADPSLAAAFEQKYQLPPGSAQQYLGR